MTIIVAGGDLNKQEEVEYVKEEEEEEKTAKIIKHGV